MPYHYGKDLPSSDRAKARLLLTNCKRLLALLDAVSADTPLADEHALLLTQLVGAIKYIQHSRGWMEPTLQTSTEHIRSTP